MEHIRSFLNDLGFLEEEQNTDTDKSSNDDDYEIKVATTDVLASTSAPLEPKKSLSFFRSSSIRRSKSSSQTHPQDIFSNSLDDEAGDLGVPTDQPNVPTKTRSFSRFRTIRSQNTGNLETSNQPDHPMRFIWYPDTRKNSDEKDEIGPCKLDVADDAPMNLLGYACGVGFCSSTDGNNSRTGPTIDEADSIVEPTWTPDTPNRGILDPVPVKKKHIRPWGHGKPWTMLALFFAWTGSICAVFTRLSTDFVNLRNPLVITEYYEPIHTMGIIRVQLCYNESIPDNMTGCKIIRFSREEVEDKTYNLSRSFFTLGSFLGMVLTLVLSTSVIWESINLRPVAGGFLVSYLLQSFSLIFFDTDLCHVYKCQMATGGYLSITSCICWIATLMAVAKMDVFKEQSIRARQRAALRATRRAQRQEKKRMARSKRPTKTIRNDDEVDKPSVNEKKFITL